MPPQIERVGVQRYTQRVAPMTENARRQALSAGLVVRVGS
jgi:hypothetical protein